MSIANFVAFWFGRLLVKIGRYLDGQNEPSIGYLMEELFLRELCNDEREGKIFKKAAFDLVRKIFFFIPFTQKLGSSRL